MLKNMFNRLIKKIRRIVPKQLIRKSPAVLAGFMLSALLSGPAFCAEGKSLEPGYVSKAGLPVITGAARTSLYFPLLEGRRVAFAGNHTSMIGQVHMVDTLLASGINLVKVFSPEHGFRGIAAAGEYVESGTDRRTGLPIISLYGTNRRPSPEQLSDVDVVVFDIQDVGVRFYTYISTMTFIMQAAARENIPVIILDRPNPLGHYVDGPILESAHASFVGLHPVPVVHGLTVGEYALMVNGERWLGPTLECDLTVIPVDNYSRNTRYKLPVPPSPNLPNMTSVYLYPSLCFFEGTVISLGRGTQKPFQVFGHPLFDSRHFPYQFTPESLPAAPAPPQLGKTCNGRDLSLLPPEELMEKNQINLEYLLEAFRHFPDKPGFFNHFFENLSGTTLLRHQVLAGLSEEQIRESWQAGLKEFRLLREKYLLYPETLR
jgi:uncharacterized protein YbbC (DUF1343 family)